MSTFNVFRDGRVHVQHRKCDTCIFRPGNLMHLDKGRVEQMVKDCGEDGHIPCHKTLYEDNQAICRGYFDLGNRTLRLAQAMGVVTFVNNNKEYSERVGPAVARHQHQVFQTRT